MILKYLSSAAFLAASSIAFSGSMGPICAPGKVALACDNLGWEFGGQALYLQPSYGDDLRFIGMNIDPQSQNTTHVTTAPNWSWGFKLEGAYHFNQAEDLNLNWYHFDGKKSRSHPDLVFFNGGASGVNTVTVKPKWDAVNLEWGKHLNLGEAKNIRLHAGAQYSYIATHITEIGSTDARGNYTASPTAKFQGIGPRLGADLGYNVLGNWSVYAHGATAILIGQSKFKNNYTLDSGSTPISLSKTIVVPEIEGKLGLNYTCNLAQGLLTLDGGYMWVNYFDAQQTYYGNDPDNNFAVNGPYFGLKWTGLAA